MIPTDIARLVVLEDAPAKYVNKLIQYAFTYRRDSKWPIEKLQTLASNLEMEPKEVTALTRTITAFVKHSMFSFTETGPEALSSEFPEDFPADLREMLVQCIGHNMEGFKAAVIDDSAVLPRFQEMDWSVNVQQIEGSNAGIPIVAMELKTRDHGKEESVSFDMDQAVLRTVVDEMQRIKSQMDAVVQAE